MQRQQRQYFYTDFSSNSHCTLHIANCSLIGSGGNTFIQISAVKISIMDMAAGLYQFCECQNEGNV